MYGVCCAFHPCNRIKFQVLDNFPDRKATKWEMDVPRGCAPAVRSIEFRVVQKKKCIDAMQSRITEHAPFLRDSSVYSEGRRMELV